MTCAIISAIMGDMDVRYLRSLAKGMDETNRHGLATRLCECADRLEAAERERNGYEREARKAIRLANARAVAAESALADLLRLAVESFDDPDTWPEVRQARAYLAARPGEHDASS